MSQPSISAAFAAVLFTGFLLCPQASSVHLVSNQPTGTDNQNDSPIQYVPKMAARLGLPPPVNREPEEDPLHVALRQLIEHNKRQSVFIERLAALAPKSNAPQSAQPRRRPANQTRTPQTSTKQSTTQQTSARTSTNSQTRTPTRTSTNPQTRTSTNPQTRTSTNPQSRTSTNPQTRTPTQPQARTSTNSQTRTLQTTTKPNDSAVAQPEIQEVEKVVSSVSVEHPDPEVSNQTLVEKVTLKVPSTLHHPNKRSKQHPVRHIIAYVPPNLPFPVQLPINSPAFYPQFVNPQSILTQRYSPNTTPYPYPTKATYPETKSQYQVNPPYPDAIQQYHYHVNPQQSPATSPVSQSESPFTQTTYPEQKSQYPVNPPYPDAIQQYHYHVTPQQSPTTSPVSQSESPVTQTTYPGHKAQYSVHPNVMQRYYHVAPQQTPATFPVFQSETPVNAKIAYPENAAQHPVNSKTPDVMQRYVYPVSPQPSPITSSVSHDSSWQYPYYPEENSRQNYSYRIRSPAGR